MKVAYVLAQAKGGLAHYTAELANAVADHAEVTVLKPIDSSADGLFSEEVHVVDAFEPLEITNAGIHRGDLQVRKNLAAMRSYANVSLLEKLDPDLVHFTAPASLLPQLQLFVRWYGLDRSFPMIETFHDVYPRTILRRGVELDAQEPLFNVALMNAVQAVDALLPAIRRDHAIVHTEHGKDTLVGRGNRPEDVSVVPHGTYEFFREYDHEGVEEESDCVLYFGNLVPTKAPDTAIKAVPLVAKERPDVTMIVAGDGTIPEDCRSIIHRNPDNFEIHDGYVPEAEVGTLFERAQLVVIPHRRQYGHSGTLTIAYSYRTPVVTSDVGDFPRLVDEPDVGVTARKNDPRSFADAILELLADDERRAAMGENAAEMADRFSWDRIAEHHLNIYGDVLASAQCEE